LPTSPSKDIYTAAPNTSLFPFGIQTPGIMGGRSAWLRGVTLLNVMAVPLKQLGRYN
jgi:hypothetical protein